MMPRPSAANATTHLIHDRTPMITEVEGWPMWLGDGGGNPSKLMRAPGNDVLRTWRVRRRVNSPGNNDTGLLDEV